MKPHIDVSPQGSEIRDPRRDLRAKTDNALSTRALPGGPTTERREAELDTSALGQIYLPNVG